MHVRRFQACTGWKNARWRWRAVYLDAVTIGLQGRHWTIQAFQAFCFHRSKVLLTGRYVSLPQPSFFSSDHAYQNSIKLFIPIVHALLNNLAVSRNILRKWQPPIEADYGLRYHKAGVLHSAVILLTVGRQAWFLYQIKRCFILDNIITLQIQCFLLLQYHCKCKVPVYTIVNKDWIFHVQPICVLICTCVQ